MAFICGSLVQLLVHKQQNQSSSHNLYWYEWFLGLSMCPVIRLLKMTIIKGCSNVLTVRLIVYYYFSWGFRLHYLLSVGLSLGIWWRLYVIFLRILISVDSCGGVVWCGLVKFLKKCHFVTIEGPGPWIGLGVLGHASCLLVEFLSLNIWFRPNLDSRLSTYLASFRCERRQKIDGKSAV